MKALIADDSPTIRERLKMFLSSYTEIEKVYETDSISQTILSASFLKPDVILLDFQMRDGNSLEVLQSINKSNYSPVIIMFTNYAYPEFKLQCLQAGADFFFDKSTEFRKVKDVINSLVSNAQSGTNLYNH